MRLTWYGHAAFLVEAAGLRVILDPYRSPDCGGYLPIDEAADLVIVSHENDKYHSHLGQVRGPFEVLRALELAPGATWARGGLTVQAVHVFETPEKSAGDEVTVLRLDAEGVGLVFLGDLGHPLTEEEVAPLRGAEVLLAAAGGPPTLAYRDVPALVETIGPRVIVPMHYKTPKIDLNIQPAERFFAALPDWPVERPGRSWAEWAPESFPGERRIVWLDHAR